MADPVITLHQERTNLPGGTYQVKNEVTAATGISAELFVYRKSDESFSHVATLSDLAYPTTVDPDQDWYRLSVAIKELADVSQALEFANHVKFRLNELMAAYTSATYADFAGTEDTVIPAPPGP